MSGFYSLLIIALQQMLFIPPTARAAFKTITIFFLTFTESFFASVIFLWIYGDQFHLP